MRIALFVLLSTACSKPADPEKTVATGSATPSAIPSAAASAVPGAAPVAVVAASKERPPELAAAHLPVGAVVTVAESKPATFEGTFNTPDERTRKETDQSACREAVKLDFAIHVVDDKGQTSRDGRGVGAHAVIGDTARICVWSWKKKVKDGAPPMIPWGSHVVLRGNLSTPIVSHHPTALLLFDGEVASASPPPTPAPPNAFPDGDSVVLVKSRDAATGAVGLDLVYLYLGDDAQRMAAARGEKLPAGQSWLLVNDSPQLRSIVLEKPSPTSVSPKRLETANGGGWRSVPLEDLTKDPKLPYIVRFEKGKLTEMSAVTLP